MDLPTRWKHCALAALVVACSSAPSGTATSPGTTHPDSGTPSDAGAADGESTETGTAPADGGDSGSPDAGGGDAAGGDAGPIGACEWGGAPGQCITVPACAAIAGYSSYPNQCPGPATIECCIKTPNPADNPPIPAGYKLMQQAQVTPDMTTWAVAILHDPVTYPMFATTTKTFGTLNVLARVEWHPPDFQNSVVHRGVTLYVPG